MSPPEVAGSSPAVGVPGAGRDLVDQRRPWLPGSLATAFTSDTVTGLMYLAVDEVLGGLVTLAVSPWPQADGLGRLRFAGSGSRGHLIVHRAELQRQIYEGWLRREPRVGDVLAAPVDPAVEARLAAGADVILDASLRLLDVLAGEEVYDVTVEARRVAKLAYYAASAPVAPYEEVRRNRQEGKVDGRVPARTSRPLRRRAYRGPVVAPADAGDAVPPWQVPARLVKPAGPTEFLDELRAEPDTLVYFLLNVGDGDTQLLLLPPDSRTPYRRAVVVDVATQGKLPALLDTLQDAQVLPDLQATPGVFPVVVATHPHDDHIGGMPEFLERFAGQGQVADFWDPGYYHHSAAFVETMVLLEQHALPRTQPTAGMTRWAGPVKLTVLGPGVGLRLRYDSYGVDINDASLTLRVEFPAARVAEQLAAGRAARERHYLRLDSPWSLVLGADAQTTSWAQVTVDFPQLRRQYDTPLYRELSAARGRDYLAGQVFKVSHHASKHGVNLELVERIGPTVALVSSIGGGGKYNFPHALATEAIREALQPSTTRGAARTADHELGIHYTGGTVVDGAGSRPLGSVALVVSPRRGSPLRMWRFGDAPNEPVDPARAARLSPVRRRD